MGPLPAFPLRVDLRSDRRGVRRGGPCHAAFRQRHLGIQPASATHVSRGGVRSLPVDDLDWFRDVARHHLGVSRRRHRALWPAVRADHSLPDRERARLLHDRPPCDGRKGGENMKRLITRRKVITTGLTAIAGASGLAAAARLADRYGLIPPDHGGIYGAGETLTYAAQRVLMSRHSLAREFAPSQISKVAPVN